MRANHGSNLEGVFHGWVDNWQHPGFADWTLDTELQRIAVPLLAFQGWDGQYATAEQLAHIARLVTAPCRTPLLDDCQYIPHREVCEAPLQLIEQFLS